MATFAEYQKSIYNFDIMATKKLNTKYCVLLPIILVITIFLWAVPTSFYGIDALTPVQQRVIALFVSPP